MPTWSAFASKGINQVRWINPQHSTYQHEQTCSQDHDLRTDSKLHRCHACGGGKDTTRKRNHQCHEARRERHLDLLRSWPIHRVLGVIRPIPSDNVRIFLFISWPAWRAPLRGRHPPRVALFRLDDVFWMSWLLFIYPVYAVTVFGQIDGKCAAKTRARGGLEGGIAAVWFFKRVSIENARDVVWTPGVIHLARKVEWAAGRRVQRAGVGHGPGNVHAHVIVWGAVARRRVVGAGYGRRTGWHFGGIGVSQGTAVGWWNLKSERVAQPLEISKSTAAAMWPTGLYSRQMQYGR